MIVVIGILHGVGQDKARLHSTINIRQAEQGLFVGTQRIVTNIKKLHAGPENVGSSLRFFPTMMFYRFFSHIAFAPQFSGLPALAERQADDMHLIALLDVQGYRATCTPDEISGVGANDKGTFFTNRLGHGVFLCCFLSACHVPSQEGNSLTCERYDFYLCCY